MSRSFFVDSLLDLSANTSVKSVKEKSVHFMTGRDKDSDEKLALRRLIGLSEASEGKLGVDYRQMFNPNKLEVNHYDNRKSIRITKYLFRFNQISFSYNY